MFSQKHLDKERNRYQYQLAYPDAWVSPRDADVVMVLGLGKCGTTTTTHLLNLSDSIVAYHEAPPRLWHLGAWAKRTGASDIMWQEILWGARRDIISSINSSGRTYGEVNHRLTFLAPAAEKLFRGHVNYIFLMRDLDGSVKSGVNWGLYSENDRNIQGRIFNPELTDVRHQVAWGWCETNEWIADFMATIPEKRRAFLPFEYIKEHNVPAIQAVFEKFGYHIPPAEEIEYTLGQHINKGNGFPVENNWQEFKDREAEIYNKTKEF